MIMCASCSSTLFSTSRTSPASVLRSSDQLLEVVSLAHELLPSVPDAAQLLLAEANPATETEGKSCQNATITAVECAAVGCRASPRSACVSSLLQDAVVQGIRSQLLLVHGSCSCSRTQSCCRSLAATCSRCSCRSTTTQPFHRCSVLGYAC